MKLDATLPLALLPIVTNGQSKNPPAPGYQQPYRASRVPNYFNNMFNDIMQGGRARLEFCAPYRGYRRPSSFSAYSAGNWQYQIGISHDPAPWQQGAQAPDGKFYIMSRGGPGLENERSELSDGTWKQITQRQPYVNAFFNGQLESLGLIEPQLDCLSLGEGPFFVTQNGDGRLFVNPCVNNLGDIIFNYLGANSGFNTQMCYFGAHDGQVVDARQHFFSAFMENDVRFILGGQRTTNTYCEEERIPQRDCTSQTGSTFGSSTTGSSSSQASCSSRLGGSNPSYYRHCDIAASVDGIMTFSVAAPTIKGENNQTDSGTEFLTYTKIYHNLNGFGSQYGFGWTLYRDMSPTNLAVDRTTGQWEDFSLSELVDRCETFFPTEENSNSTLNDQYTGMREVCNDARREQFWQRVVIGIFVGGLGLVGIGACCYYGGPRIAEGCEDATEGCGAALSHCNPTCPPIRPALNHAANSVSEGCTALWQSMRNGCTALSNSVSDCYKSMTASNQASKPDEEEVGEEPEVVLVDTTVEDATIAETTVAETTLVEATVIDEDAKPHLPTATDVQEIASESGTGEPEIILRDGESPDAHNGPDQSSQEQEDGQLLSAVVEGINEVYRSLWGTRSS